MNLLVGCPVSHREWILPVWFSHVERASLDADLIPSYIFVVSVNDDATLRAIADFAEAAKGKRSVVVVATDEPVRQDVRNWNEARHHHMVGIRNLLLSEVRVQQPAFFLSLDSDLLLRSDSLGIALQEIGDADALGLHCYMDRVVTPPHGTQVVPHVGRQLASKGDIVGNHIVNRQHYETYTSTHEVGCIMAAKLMKPTAYNIDYQWHFEGEDPGWSLACKQAGLTLAWCPRACAKHVFVREDLNKRDFRVGF